MTPSQTYFNRNRGAWDWKVRLQLTSWLGLWRNQNPLLSKICLSFFILAQRLLGPFRMWTDVQFKEGENIVHHSTVMSKWGVTVYKSEKDFFLLEDGYSLRLEGAEYFWPFIFLIVPFSPKTGAVSSSTTTATYKMPLAGIECDCQTFLNKPEGFIEIMAPGLRGRFSLTKGSQEKLAERLR